MAYDALSSNALFAGVLWGMRAGVAAVVASAAFDMCAAASHGKLAKIILAGVFAASFLFNVSPPLLIIASAAAGISCFLYQSGKQGIK
jgi:chromate transport protein ChrA